MNNLKQTALIAALGFFSANALAAALLGHRHPLLTLSG